MLGVCFSGIFIASFALALILSIMNGFEQTTHKKLQGMHADIIMQAPGQHINFQALQPILQTCSPIAAFSPSDVQQGLITNQTSDEMPLVVMIKGIEPTSEAQTTCLEQFIISSDKKLPVVVHGDSILIGYKLAQQLEATCNDTVQLLVPIDQTTKKNTIQLQSITVNIGGVFKSGIEEFDTNLVICSLDFLNSILPESGISFINIKTKPGIDSHKLIEQLQERTGLDVYSWKELYPALVSALKLEKYAAFLVLSLIVLVASMSILSLVYMFITYKRTDIAILQAMGAPKRTIRGVFILIGMILSTLASSAGLLCAFLVGIFLKNYFVITLPDAYYTTTLPVSPEPKLFVIIFLTILLLTLLATVIPLYNLKGDTISADLKT